MFQRRQFMIGSGAITGFFATEIAQAKKPSQEKTMDGTEITNIVNRIAILSDLRDWTAVRQCFTDQVAVDYTSLEDNPKQSQQMPWCNAGSRLLTALSKPHNTY